MDSQEKDTTKMHMPTESLMTTHRSHMGLVLTVLTIVLVAIGVGMYFWGTSLFKQGPAIIEDIVQDASGTDTLAPPKDVIPEEQMYDAVTPSDELSAIEKDLEDTDLNIIDTKISTIGHELGSVAGQE